MATKFVADDWGKLILRVTVGGLLLMHGIAKLINGVDPVMGLLADKGLPGVIAYGVYIGEVLAPLFMIIGFYARAAAVVVVLNMCAAIYLAHSRDLLALSEHGSWKVESPMFFLLAALAVALLGTGQIAVKKS